MVADRDGVTPLELCAQVSFGIWCACSYIVHVCVCVYMYICVCAYVCVHVCTCMCVCGVYVCVCVCVKQLDYTTDEHIVAELCMKDQLMK